SSLSGSLGQCCSTASRLESFSLSARESFSAAHRIRSFSCFERYHEREAFASSSKLKTRNFESFQSGSSASRMYLSSNSSWPSLRNDEEEVRALYIASPGDVSSSKLRRQKLEPSGVWLRS